MSPRRNPARARREEHDGVAWRTVPPRLTEGHARLPEVELAVATAEGVRARGALLGQGNFGVTYAVAIEPGELAVVKGLRPGELPALSTVLRAARRAKREIDDFVEEGGERGAVLTGKELEALPPAARQRAWARVQVAMALKSLRPKVLRRAALGLPVPDEATAVLDDAALLGSVLI